MDDSNITKITKRLESLQVEIDSLVEKIETSDDIRTLKIKKSEKENDLESRKKKWFQFLYTNEKRFLEEGIKDLDKEIVRKERIRNLKEEVEKNKTILSDISVKAWGDFPCSLDSSVVGRLLELFDDYLHPVTPNVPKINIMMIGETGAGKSSFLNTIATALAGSTHVKDTYRVGRSSVSDKSVTKKVKLESLYLRGKNQPVAINFYDIPGIALKNEVRKEEIAMLINGEIKPNTEIIKASEMRKKTESIRHNPTLADEIHCILFVVKASSNFSIRRSPILNLIHEIRQTILEDDIKQFALVTHIDKIGVPNDDMENAFRYRCLTETCQKVSNVFDFDLHHVIPVSNYHGESFSSNAKNAMSLIALWRVCSSGKDYIKQQNIL